MLLPSSSPDPKRAAQEYEKRLQRDLDQFKLQQQKHLADIKEAHRLSMAREIASMREQRDIAHADVERLEASTRAQVARRRASARARSVPGGCSGEANRAPRGAENEVV